MIALLEHHLGKPPESSYPTLQNLLIATIICYVDILEVKPLRILRTASSSIARAVAFYPPVL
jgi:hypothetical protein